MSSTRSVKCRTSFDRRICIDVEKSRVGRKIVKDGLTMIFGVSGIVHHPDCLQGSHMARDLQLLSHVVISNELKEALAATGEDSVFKVPTGMAR
ncbi:hypothetical protein [Sphingorhabdus sp.]|uniref:hypothetical protein n=1 Tax=Sphingorhabdus sp. TaxID=1902408 RepID=UPI00359305AD